MTPCDVRPRTWGIDAEGRGFDELASLVVATAEEQAGVVEAEPFVLGGTVRVGE